MLTKDELEQIGEVVDQRIKPLQEGQERIEKTQQEQGKVIVRLEQGQAQTNTTVAQIKTGVEALAAGQQDVREQMATKHDVERLEKGQREIKATVQDVDAKLVKRVNSHEKRIDDLEKEAGIPNPHKN